MNLSETGTNSSDVLIKVDNVSKRFSRSLKRSLWYGLQDLVSELGGHRHGGGAGLPQSSGDVSLRKEEFWAVKDVSFELRRGECLGLIGCNGAGKTTLLRILNGLIKPDTGSIELQGRLGALIALGAGFNPILTGRENIYTNASVLGIAEREAKDKVKEIIEFSELDEFIDAPVQSYSSGMQVRLGFAVATALKPDILILDEVLAVGDRAFRHKCLARVSALLKDTAVIFVSHDESQIRQTCDRVIWLAKGKSQFVGPTEEGLNQYTDSNNSEHEKQEIVLPPVRSASVIQTSLQSGSDSIVAFQIKLDMAYEKQIDYVVVSINAPTGELAAMTFPNGLPVNLHAGSNHLTIESNPLDLKPGTYSVSLFIRTNGGKELLFSSLYCGSVEIQNGMNLWSYYQPGSKIEIKSVNAKRHTRNQVNVT